MCLVEDVIAENTGPCADGVGAGVCVTILVHSSIVSSHDLWGWMDGAMLTVAGEARNDTSCCRFRV